MELAPLDLGIFKSKARILDSIPPPTIPFQVPAWTMKETPIAIAIIDVFKANELMTSIKVDTKPSYLIGRNALVCDIVLEHCSISRYVLV